MGFQRERERERESQVSLYSAHLAKSLIIGHHWTLMMALLANRLQVTCRSYTTNKQRCVCLPVPSFNSNEGGGSLNINAFALFFPAYFNLRPFGDNNSTYTVICLTKLLRATGSVLRKHICSFLKGLNSIHMTSKRSFYLWIYRLVERLSVCTCSSLPHQACRHFPNRL